ncbi:hypothetical protein DL96DRAFT_1620553 [Flagelloscypha sp. PMI_526]|nr:hypothetical protein DL96DRAFT_1620553 [Flagelloscypha sp. PMI_526]
MESILYSQIQALPIELQVEILEVVAWQSTKKRRLELMLLGKKAYACLDKVFYYTIWLVDVSQTQTNSEKIIRSLRDLFASKPPGYFAEITRGLCIVLVGTSPVATVLKKYIFPALSGVQHLVIHGSVDGSPFPDDISSILELPLQSWLVDPSFYASPFKNLGSHPPDPRCRALETLTHMTFIIGGRSLSLDLQCFKSVAYVFMHVSSWDFTMSEYNFIEECCTKPSVRVVALAASNMNDLPTDENERRWRDGKYVKLVVMDPPGFDLEVWSAFVEGRDMLWSKLEEWVENRRGEFSGVLERRDERLEEEEGDDDSL